jgi:hypothetical protein
MTKSVSIFLETALDWSLFLSGLLIKEQIGDCISVAI